ncbi:protein of unknown function (plasmid) [Azospirillum baldaniorum]|uniref:Uncharacterized protein n=1 Tax=Azospirillum baldaniorum TaxID=1064539 RepID=A0A9P1NQQ5_9PROT|nr:protein of unknown function [Azospirillum baldaniorum]
METDGVTLTKRHARVEFRLMTASETKV